jgi:hypothetical protein
MFPFSHLFVFTFAQGMDRLTKASAMLIFAAQPNRAVYYAEDCPEAACTALSYFLLAQQGLSIHCDRTYGSNF